MLNTCARNRDQMNYGNDLVRFHLVSFLIFADIEVVFEIRPYKKKLNTFEYIFADIEVIIDHQA